MKWLILPFLVLCIHSTPAEKKIKANTAVSKNKKTVPGIHQRKINQIPETLNKAVDSVIKSFDELTVVCQSKSPLNQRVSNFQKKLTAIKENIRQIKKDFRISDPSIHSYIHTVGFYLNRSEEFNYEAEIPKETDKLKKYISGLALSFQYMYQSAFNIPESVSMSKFPEGWGRSIGIALTCLNHDQ